MKRVKRNYSKEFKEEAVRLSYQRENIKELAIELGIDVARIYKYEPTCPDVTATKTSESEGIYKLPNSKRSGDVKFK